MNNKESKSFNSKTLLTSLYHSHHSPAFFTSQQNNPYGELNEFRKKMEEERLGPHHRPYQTGQKKAITYKIIFFGLAVLFLFLCLFMYTQTMNWSGTLFFVNYHATKTTICLFTLALSILCFLIGYSITVEKEAANQLIHRAQNKMRRILAYKRAEYGMNRFLSFHQHFKKDMVIKQEFHDFWEKIKESKKVTYGLLEHIADTKGLDFAAKEKLFNQALLELNDKLHHIIYDFKKKLSTILDDTRE